MCGIAGVINFNQKPADESILREMIGKVRYRGPNDEGYFVNENAGLGHCRLSIIDLSKAGHQPMANENNKIWLAYNGEIYNYIELREELKKAGHIFKSNTDTEVIIHAYEEWGGQGFKKFNGMWAFAILDLNKNKLILSRDRFSVKPLYYAFCNNSFYFGSEIKEIKPFLTKKELNIDAMYKFLRQGLLDYNEETFFLGIRKLKPMHNLIIDLKTGKTEEQRYWNYTKEDIREERAIEKFKALFEDSIKLRLRSDLPIGVLLSGGLDSSSIAVTANKLIGENLRCFSVVSSEKKYSEEKFIDILINKRGLRVDKLFLNSEISWGRLQEVVAHNDEPFGGFSLIAHNQMLEKIKKDTDIVVLLNGQGGDEILAGYRKFFFFYLKEQMRKGRYLNVLRNILLSFAKRTIAWQVLTEPQLWPAAMNYIFINKKRPLDDIFKIKRELEQAGDAGTLRDRQILDINKYSVPVLAHYEDIDSMFYSLEMRLPLLDYRLVNFSLSLADDFKIKNGRNKYILRKAITDLPKEIAWRRFKRGFSTPEEKWIKEDFKDRVLEIFNESHLDKIGMIDKNKLLENYKKFLGGSNKMCHLDFIRFVIAELWLRKFYGRER